MNLNRHALIAVMTALILVCVPAAATSYLGNYSGNLTFLDHFNYTSDLTKAATGDTLTNNVGVSLTPLGAFYNGSEYNGSNYLSAASNTKYAIGTGPFTLLLHLNLSRIPSQNGIFSTGGSSGTMDISITTARQVHLCNVGIGCGYQSSAITLNTSHQIVFVRYSNYTTMTYVDGVLNNTASNTNSYGQSGLNIGYGEPAFSKLIGSLDEVALWNTSINITELWPQTYEVEGAIAGAPVASFTASNTSGLPPLLVQFTDTSADNPSAWGWNATCLENETTIQFSTDQNPTQTFDAGHWLISLIITTGAGQATSTQETWINATSAMDPLIVKFTGVQTIPSVGKKQVVLTDTSTGPTILSRIWTATEIGNGTPVEIGTTTPLTVILGTGNYSIVLNASAAIEANSTAENAYWVNVSASDSSSVPIVDFSANATAICYGAAVEFTDTSTNVSSWSWTFGDGGTSTEQNPTHVYNISSGYFTVALTGTNGLGSDTETKTNYIEVQGSCSGGGTTPTTRPFSSATGQTTILAALSIIGTGLIVFGAVFVYAAFKNQSTAGLTLGIFVITLGAIILIMSYAVISPIMNLV